MVGAVIVSPYRPPAAALLAALPARADQAMARTRAATPLLAASLAMSRHPLALALGERGGGRAGGGHGEGETRGGKAEESRRVIMPAPCAASGRRGRSTAISAGMARR